MDDNQREDTPRSTGRFTVLTNPVRAFAERAANRAWRGRHGAKNVPPNPEASAAASHAAGTQPIAGAAPRGAGAVDETGPQPFVTSEVISAFHLQQLRVPSTFERVTQGAARGGKVAIGTSVVLLFSLLGFGYWDGPGVTAEQQPASAAPTATVGSAVASAPASEESRPDATRREAQGQRIAEPSQDMVTGKPPLSGRSGAEAVAPMGVGSKSSAGETHSRLTRAKALTSASTSRPLPLAAITAAEVETAASPALVSTPAASSMAVVETPRSSSASVTPKPPSDPTLPAVPRVYRLP